MADDDSEKNEDSEDEGNENEDSESEDNENEDLKFDNSDHDDDEDGDSVENDGINKDLMVPKKKLNSEDSDSDDDSKLTKSSFEERQQRLKQHVEKLEEDLLAEKPWHLKGEITAKTRPEDSLLSQVLEFDVGSRPGILYFL